jgi:hypothetical protein
MRLRGEREMAANSKPVHPLVTVTGLAVKVSGEYLGLVAETLGQLYWIGRDCAYTNEFFEIEKAMRAETDALYYEQIAPVSTMLAEPKVELQRWVVRGVYDRSVLGIPQVGITVEGWGTDITLQGLSGEQRHRLLKRYRQTQDVFEFLDGVLLYCARDPIEPGQLFFSSLAAVQEMRSTVSRELTKVALWLSGLTEGPDSGPPRAGTDTSDSAFLLRAVRLAVSDPETLRIRQDIVNHFLWSNKDSWESAPGPSLFGWLGTTLKRAWLRWVKDGTLDGDVWIDGKGHSHKGRQKQVLRGNEALDYIANRERIGARSQRRPDCSDSDRDPESRHGSCEWALDRTHGLQQIETEEDQTQESEAAERLVNTSDADLTHEGNQEIAVTRRSWRNLWLYKRPSSLDLGDFEKWIDPEIDIQRTLDDVYEVTKASAVLLDQAPTTAAYQPNGFVRIGSKRAAQRARRDAEVFIMRTCEDADDGDIPLVSGLSAKEVAAAVRNLSDDRKGEKITKALRQGRTPARRSPPGRKTGGAFGVPCSGAAVSMFESRDSSGRSGPCKVIVRDGIKLDQPAVLQAPPKEVHL